MAGDFEETRKAIATTFSTEWATRTPIEWPNGETFEPDQDAAWVRFNINSGETLRRTIGGPKALYRRVGQVVIQVFAPLNSGDGSATRHADFVADIFRDRTLLTEHGTIKFRAPTIREIGASDNLWYQVNAICPFQREFLGA